VGASVVTGDGVGSIGASVGLEVGLTVGGGEGESVGGS